VQPMDRALVLQKYLFDRARGCSAQLGADSVIHDLGDGSAVLRPSVRTVTAPDPSLLGTELPFPCVWFARWNRADGIAPLRDTLVLTAMTRDASLVDELLAEPTIRNVYVGDHPTHWLRPGVPHDGYLGEFLMESKAVIRD
jgi:hypothetical protein